MNGALALLGFDLLRPQWAAAALAALVVLVVGAWGVRARVAARRALVAERHAERFLPRFSANRARLRVVLASLALLFGALALLGPVRGYTLRDVQRKGLDLVVCVDTSRSMLVQDVKPDRLTRARREVLGLLDKLQGDRVALLAFAGDVRHVAPLTHDRATLGAFVKTLNTDENLKGGTDLGLALEHALKLFDGKTGAHEAIILITDGEDLEARGLAVALEAKQHGIRVYVVGMGTPEGGKIPEADHRGFVRDETGKEVVSSLDGTSLATLAESTGGAYLSIANATLPLEELYEKRIARLEARELVAGKERIPHDRFQWPLALTLLCLLCEFGLREKRPARQRAAAPAVPPARSLPDTDSRLDKDAA